MEIYGFNVEMQVSTAVDAVDVVMYWLVAGPTIGNDPLVVEGVQWL